MHSHLNVYIYSYSVEIGVNNVKTADRRLSNKRGNSSTVVKFSLNVLTEM